MKKKEATQELEGWPNNVGANQMPQNNQIRVCIVNLLIIQQLLDTLTLSTLVKSFSRQHIEFFFLHKTDLTFHCKLSQLEKICMKCQSLLSGKKTSSVCHLLNFPLEVKG